MSAPLPWRKTGGAPELKCDWGPRGWYWLHAQAIDYPADPSKQNRITTHTRFWEFVQTLPCPECRRHATDYVRAYPIDLADTMSFQTWAWRFHNAVNRRLGKLLMDAASYRAAYAEEMSRCYWSCIE